MKTAKHLSESRSINQSLCREDRVPWQPVASNRFVEIQAKRAFTIVLGKMLQPAPYGRNDMEVPYLRAANVQWGRVALDDVSTMWASPSEISQLALESGDLLVCEGGEVGRCAKVRGTLPENCVIQNALHRVRGKDLGYVGFLQYCLGVCAETGWIDVLCNKATIAHFTVEKFNDLWMRIPTVSEQKQISDYLDRETAAIDALVKEKERMLELLNEKRTALISRVVTRGLDSRAPTKTSGIPWLGDIPKHWELKRGKRLFKEIDDRTDTGEETLLSLRMERGLVPHNDVSEKPILPSDLLGYKRVKVGEVVLNRMRAASGLVAVASEDGIVSPDYAVFRMIGEVNPHYFVALFKTRLFQAAFRALSKGLGTGQSGFLRLYSEDFLAMAFPVPPTTPKNEQSAIVAAIRHEDERTAEIRRALTDSIRLLKERRASLITAAVTGQVSV